jgi:uncharacterized protein YbcC (UPF0753/DUF2309 family)/NADH:ubiquinone oxidoreductase subunit 5 (subunit L)/multisubunit Na+/H+ antiporter MnhA subunit
MAELALSVVVLVPMLVTLLAPGAGGRRWPDKAVAAGWTLAALAAATLVVLGPAELGRTVGLAGVPITVGVAADRFVAVFLTLVCVVALVTSRYARRYLDGEPAAGRFQARLALTATATVVLATAPNLAQLAVGWIVAGLGLTSLIGHYREQPAARAARRRVRRVFAVGDVALLAAVAVAALRLRELDLDRIGAAATTAGTADLVTLGLLLLLAAMVRSAQVPFHGWLPATLAAPTPVSALLHAGLVNVAGFLLIRLSPVFTASRVVLAAVLVVGLLTAVTGTLAAAVRTDAKGALARSTVAQMGFMVVQCGLGAYGFAAVHLVGHGLFKAYAFLSAGGVVQARRDAVTLPAATPRPWWSRLPAALAVLAAAAAGELAAATVLDTGVSPVGLLSAALAGCAALAAVGAFTADRALPARWTAAAVLVTGLATAGWLVAAAGARVWLDLPGTVAGPVTVAGLAVVLAGTAVLWHLGRRGHLPRLWALAWRDGLVDLLPRWRPGAYRMDRAVTAVSGRELIRVAADVPVATDVTAELWPLQTFVAVNPLAGLERLSFDEATARMRAVAGVRTHPDLSGHRDRYAAGRITADDLAAALAGRERAGLPGLVLAGRRISGEEFARAVLVHGSHDGPPPPPALTAAAGTALSRCPSVPDAADDGPATVGDLLDAALGSTVVADVNRLVADWCTAYCGRSAATWPVPGRDGFWRSWRRFAAVDPAPRMLGVAGFGRYALATSTRPAHALASALRALGVPEEARVAYLSRSLAQLPGWAAHVKWRDGHDSPWWPAVNPTELLAVRLTYERALAEAVAQRRLGIPATLAGVRLALAGAPARRPAVDAQSLARTAQALGLDAATVTGLPRTEVQALVTALAGFGPQRQAQVWLDAAEHAHRRTLVGMLDRPVEEAPTPVPTAQAVFCIDVRSEGLRRHLERVADVHTYGFAGFFGLPVRTVAADADHGQDRCPVLIKPVTTVAADPTGTPADGDRAHAPARPGGVTRRLLRDRRRAWAAAKANPLGAYAFVELAGVLAAVGFLARTVAPGLLGGRPVTADDRYRLDATVGTGLTLDEKVYYAEAALRTIGLVTGFAPVVLLCGHGGTSENNPHAAALDCGACGGHRGDVSARLAAAMFNEPDVRAGLAARGIDIPADTLFVAGEHDTVTNTVRLLDRDLVPDGHAGRVEALRAALAAAGSAVAAERSAGLPDQPAPGQRHRRSADWSQVRPEWALVGNAAFVAGPRSLTAGLDLGCRAFLHSYDWRLDTDGAALETILTAPMVVASWINLQYYFSTVDPDRFGAGTKTVHNVVGGALGALSGAGGDLRVGLPWQSVGHGTQPVHEPLRLLAVVRAPRRLVDDVVGRNPALRDLLDGGWVAMVAADPADGGWWQRRPGGDWVPTARDTGEESASSDGSTPQPDPAVPALATAR